VHRTPADWSVERKREYFDWARLVVDRMSGTNEGLEELFDVEHQKRP
jgi:guanosine-3',5'-bis(diphosphate) 3'-pyrophosphohydrolase